MPDILAETMKPAPALSATSDMPVIDITKPSEPLPVDAKTEAVDAKPTEAEKPPGEPDAGAEETGESGKDAPPWVKGLIAAQRSRARAAEQRAAQAEARANQAFEAVSKLVSESREAQDQRPDRTTFADPDAYEQALVDWAGRQAEGKAKADAERVTREEAQKSETKRLIDAHQARVDAFIADHDDYEAKVMSDDLAITPTMGNAIISDEDGPAVAYYLGQNPDEAKRIAALSPIRQVAEIGRIAAKLANPPTKPVKPDPITPLGSRAAGAPKDRSEMTAEEYMAARLPELQAQRRPLTGFGRTQ